MESKRESREVEGERDAYVIPKRLEVEEEFETEEEEAAVDEDN